MISTTHDIHNQQFQLKPHMRFHLVGIGGAGISAIARVLSGRGFVVSGSDKQTNELTAALEAEGILIHQGHQPQNIGDADALVISSAIPETNPEILAAKAKGIPVLKRADLLGHLMAGMVGIAVSGTHGKTTTSGMVAHILIKAGLDPTVILGGTLPSLSANGRHGEGDFFVVEADEYDNMFLGLRPQMIVITNLEHDHPDVFPTLDDYLSAFRDFAKLLPADGRLIACIDDTGVSDFLTELNLLGVKKITYSLSGEDDSSQTADFQALDCRPNPLGGMDFLVARSESGQSNPAMLGLARLRVPGLHNVRNALAAIAVSLEIGVEFDIIRRALADFGGIGRRFQVVGEVGRVIVIDDYAHHPTEIRATLLAARQRYPGRRLWAIWQPHTYSRTRLLLDQFVDSFEHADRVIALDIYRSREKDTLGMDTSIVLAAMDHPYAVHVSDHEEAAAYILDRVRPDDVVMTLSAGDGNLVGQRVLDGLKERVRED